MSIILQENKKKPQMGTRSLQNIHLIKELVCSIYRELSKLNSKNIALEFPGSQVVRTPHFHC